LGAGEAARGRESRGLFLKTGGRIPPPLKKKKKKKKKAPCS